MLEKCVLTILELNWNQRLGHKKTKINFCHHMLTSSTQPQNRQPRSQGLSSLPSLVAGTEALVAADHVTIYPSKTAGWVGTQVHLVERTIEYHPVVPPFQQIFLPPSFWVVT